MRDERPPASWWPGARRAACLVVATLAAAGWAGCSRDDQRAARDTLREAARAGRQPSILLVTLDTTRADAVAPETGEAVTPHLARLAASGRVFHHAYATAPMTLPAHASLLTGLYPAAHGIHDNGRTLAPQHPTAAERLAAQGYATAAFVSSWVLDRRFGLARGFATYDDALPDGGEERPADATTDRALAWLAAQPPAAPLFLWVHYFDAHAPYEPPEPFRSRFAADPYRGEVAFADAQLGRLADAFAARDAGAAGHRLVVVGDHGEGLGDHGEAQHGMLLYQGVMRVPLVLAGDGVAAGAVAAPVSARRVHDTVLAWAGVAAAAPLPAAAAGGDAGEEAGPTETVLGEAMTPYLAYGWQPQAMAVRGRWKAIRAGAVEVYDVVADPAETRDLAGSVQVPREQLTALRDYPLPGAAAAPVDDETRRRLASLGYTAAGGARPVREGAPRPAAMTHLFADLDRATALFSAGRHAEALPVLAALAERDPGNPLVAVQAAVSHSLLGHPEEALRWFERARRIDPGSPELQHALGLHHCRREEWQQAEPLLLATVAREPGRLPAVECLARLREAGGRPLEAAELLERLAAASRDPSPQLLRAGDLRMSAGDTAGAIAAFERALAAAGDGFDRHLELGVLYLAARRLPEARTALDAALVAEPGEPMALFKRAQVSVLLGEPDARARVRAAEAAADATTAPMIARERLFAGLR